MPDRQVNGRYHDKQSKPLWVPPTKKIKYFNNCVHVRIICTANFHPNYCNKNQRYMYMHNYLKVTVLLRNMWTKIHVNDVLTTQRVKRVQAFCCVCFLRQHSVSKNSQVLILLFWLNITVATYMKICRLRATNACVR